MTLEEDVRTLTDFESGLRYADIRGLLKFYTGADFPKRLTEVATILSKRGIHQDLISQLVATGMYQRTYYERIKPTELMIANLRTSASFLFPTGSDPFLVILTPLVDKVTRDRDNADTGRILKQIDAEFKVPIDELISTIPTGMESAKENLVKAARSFSEGRAEESALFTRMAWESCVNFALTKLPKGKGLDSLSKKTQYVLDQIGLLHQSKFISNLKNLYEGTFLHALDAKAQVESQDLPLYIALTIGFVHLVASRLA